MTQKVNIKFISLRFLPFWKKVWGEKRGGQIGGSSRLHFSVSQLDCSGSSGVEGDADHLATVGLTDHRGGHCAWKRI